MNPGKAGNHSCRAPLAEAVAAERRSTHFSLGTGLWLNKPLLCQAPSLAFSCSPHPLTRKGQDGSHPQRGSSSPAHGRCAPPQPDHLSLLQSLCPSPQALSNLHSYLGRLSWVQEDGNLITGRKILWVHGGSTGTVAGGKEGLRVTVFFRFHRLVLHRVPGSSFQAHTHSPVTHTHLGHSESLTVGMESFTHAHAASASSGRVTQNVALQPGPPSRGCLCTNQLYSTCLGI